MRKSVKHKESGLPKKYVGKLSDSTARARKAHWKKMSKYSDRDPRAYEPAPGDATAKTKPSKATREVRKMMNKEEATLPNSKTVKLKKFIKQLDKSVKTHAAQRDTLKDIVKMVEKVEITEEASKSLAAKAKKTGIPLSTLKTVYRRGVAAWNSGHRPGTTPQQWGHARVNSYIRKGKGTYYGTDKDLREQNTIHSQHNGQVREAKDPKEYGFEGDMAMSQLKGIMNHAQQLNDMLEPNTDLPEWVQSKITKAYDYIQTAADYMATEMNEEIEQIDELSKDTLKSYVNKADARLMNRTIDNPKAHKKVQNKTFGIEKAVKKIREESAVNSVGASNVAGLQGEPPVHMKKKKKNIMTFKRYMKK